MQSGRLGGPVTPPLPYLFDASKVMASAPVAGAKGCCGIFIEPPIYICEGLAKHTDALLAMILKLHAGQPHSAVGTSPT